MTDMAKLLQVALLLLDLRLGECGQQALQAAGTGQGIEEVPGLELALCCSRAASLVGDDTGVWSCLTVYHCRPAVLVIHFSKDSGRHSTGFAVHTRFVLSW